MAMKRYLLIPASLLLFVSGAASAQSMGDLSKLFPSNPCHDGWAACLVDGEEMSAEPGMDAAGRPMPADLRVDWFDLEASVALNPFVELSAYTGELPTAVAAATDEDNAMDALLDGDVPADDEPAVEDEPDDEPVVADVDDEPSGSDDRDRPSAFETTSGGSEPAPLLEPSRFDDEPEPEPEPIVEPEPEPEPEPILEPEPIEDEPVAMLEEPVVLDGAVTCDNLVALEPTALMGKLNVAQAECLEGRIATSPTMTDKDKTSRVLLANAEAKGDKREWERLMRRHLEEIDRSDPNLCFKYALHLSRGGVGRAWGVIKWADYALENKSQWSGATYKSRVYSLYQLKAEAANKLWEDANAKLVNAEGGEREELSAKEEKMRGMSKDYAMEWLDYARASAQDTKKPMSLCVAAAGSKKYCQE
jgi:hypothetical protein